MPSWVGGTGSWNATTTHWSATSGGSGGAPIPTSTTPALFDANSGGGTATVAAGNTGCQDLDTTGYTGTFAGSTALNCSGSLTWGASLGGLTYTGTITLNDTSGTQRHIKSNGKQTVCQITCNGAGGKWKLDDTFNSTKNFVVINGTFEANAQTMTVLGLFLQNAGTKSANFDGATVNLAGTGSIMLSAAAGLTFSAVGSTFKKTDASATLTQWQMQGCVLDTILVLAGTGTFQFGALQCGDLDFTGFKGLWGASVSGSQLVKGNLTLDPGMLTASSSINLIMVATVGPKTITSNGVKFNWPVQINAVAGVTVQLGDALNIDTTRALSLATGTFFSNGKDVTTGAVSAGNTNVRTLDLTNSLVTLNNISGTKIVWNTANNVNLTLVVTGSRVVIDSTGGVGTQAQQFLTNFDSFPSIECKGTGAGGFDLGGTNVDDVKLTQANTILYLSRAGRVKRLRVTGPNTVRRGTANYTRYRGNAWVSAR